MNWNREKAIKMLPLLSLFWLVMVMSAPVATTSAAAQCKTVLEPNSDATEISVAPVPKYNERDNVTSVETLPMKFIVGEDKQDGGKTMPREIWTFGSFSSPGQKPGRPATVSLFFSEIGIAKAEHGVRVVVRFVEKGREASISKTTSYDYLLPGQWPVTVSGVGFTAEEFIRISQSDEVSMEIDQRGYILHIAPSYMPFLRALAQAIPDK